MEAMAKKKSACVDWRTLLMAAVLLCIISRVALLLFPLAEERWKFIVPLVCAGLTGPVFGMTGMGRERGMRILITAYLWMVLSSLLHFSCYRDPEMLLPYLMTAAFSMFLLYPAAFVLRAAQARKLFILTAGVYIACIAVLAAIMLAAGFAGVYLPSPGGPEALGIGAVPELERLGMFCNPIEGGVYCAIAMLLIFPLWQETVGKTKRALLLVAAAILFLALSVSDARTPSWSFCACIGGAAYLLTEKRLAARKPAVRFAASVLAALAAAALCFAVMRILATLLNPLIAGVRAVREADSKATTLTGRTAIWQAAVDMLRDNPSALWTGAGPGRAMPIVQRYFTLDETILAHPHSIVLSILITFGIPGLVLFGAFAAYAGFHAVRLFFFAGKRCTFSERALPLILVFCLIVDLIETFLSFNGMGDHSNFWFFFAAGYVVNLSNTKLSRTKTVLAAPAG